MNTLAVDIGSQHVGICRWDGRMLHVHKEPVRAPTEVWDDWLAIASPAQPYQLLYRCTNEAYKSGSFPGGIESFARSRGARWARVLSDDPIADPAVALARHCARRHRLGGYVVAECGASWAVFARIGLRDEVIAYRRCPIRGADKSVSTDVACAAMRDLVDAPTDALICMGGSGPGMAAELAEACGANAVLIPDQAGAAGTIGMHMADIVLSFSTDTGGGPLDMTVLRTEFRKLMDTACSAITMEGYDLDDAECRRFAIIGTKGTDQASEVPCDNLGDDERVMRAFASALGVEASRQSEIELRELQVRAVVQAFEMDPPISRDRLGTDNRVEGPAEIRESFTTTIIPTGWTCEPTPAGALKLTPS